MRPRASEDKRVSAEDQGQVLGLAPGVGHPGPALAEPDRIVVALEQEERPREPVDAGQSHGQLVVVEVIQACEALISSREGVRNRPAIALA